MAHGVGFQAAEDPLTQARGVHCRACRAWRALCFQALRWFHDTIYYSVLPLVCRHAVGVAVGAHQAASASACGMSSSSTAACPDQVRFRLPLNPSRAAPRRWRPRRRRPRAARAPRARRTRRARPRRRPPLQRRRRSRRRAPRAPRSAPWSARASRRAAAPAPPDSRIRARAWRRTAGDPM
jgi:hypothetical protein